MTTLGIRGSSLSDITWSGASARGETIDPSTDWVSIGGAIFAALIAGAASRVLDMSLKYAEERKQFGKPIAAFQAIQQQLAVLAQNAFAARIAAQQAFGADHIDPVLCAIAKSKASAVVPTVNAIGHMAHGAIGITEEYDLQLYTRRLLEWRQCFGGALYWNRLIGELLLSSDGGTLCFIRSAVGR